MIIPIFRSIKHYILYSRDNYFTLNYLFGESNLFPSKFIICIQSQIWSSQFEAGMNMRWSLWINNLIYCFLHTEHRSSHENNLCEKKSKLILNLCTYFFHKLFKTKSKSLVKCFFCFWLKFQKQLWDARSREKMFLINIYWIIQYFRLMSFFRKLYMDWR